MSTPTIWQTIKNLFTPPTTPNLVARVLLPQDVAETTAELIASFGYLNDPHEGIAYLAGQPGADWSIVTTVIVPDAQHTRGSYRTSSLSNAQVIKTINDLGLQIIAQVHGHPADWVGHSEEDNRGAFMPFEGFFSIVLPRYGQQGMMPLEKCGIHRFNGRQFVQLTAEDIWRGFSIIPGKIDLRRKCAANTYA